MAYDHGFRYVFLYDPSFPREIYFIVVNINLFIYFLHFQCILYSSCVCFGTVGRQLMIIPEEWFEEKEREKNGEVVVTKNTKLE